MNAETSLKVPVFNIVNGSFVDGFGIRTTIFLKGCPLRCHWCCNPEGQQFFPQLRFLAAHCVDDCTNCINRCPQGALSKSGGLLSIDRSRCNHCGACIEACWYDALSLYGQWYTPEEIFPLIVREKAFFDASGGGLTIGGGEASCYPAFCRRLMDLCHEQNIPVAIDSCGYMLWPDSIKVLEEADLVLFDLKGMDDERHRTNTGVSNQSILDVFAHMTAISKPVIVRLPLIPGYNDSPEELERLAELLQKSQNVRRVDLMPYHTYGLSKYDELGIAYPMTDRVSPYSEEEVAALLCFFKSFGLQVQIGG